MIFTATLRRTVFRLFAVTAVVFTAASGFCQPLSYSGELGPGDDKLGRYFDTYPLQLAAGERLVATLSSHEFDAYLILEAPDGSEFENDDYGEEDDARLDVLIDATGIWKVKATSYEEQEQGAYTLTVLRERLQQLKNFSGALDEQDAVSVKGEYYDSYTVDLEANRRVLISMRSEHIDPFLVLKPPRGARIFNDDYEEQSEARLDFIPEFGGHYELFATSFEGGEQGEYSLQILLGERMNLREINGYLNADDPVHAEYGYYETLSLFLEQGERIILEMHSGELDTLLMVEGPDGFYAENDDYNEQTSVSRLELFAPVTGEYVVAAGCYDAGVEGAYSLKIYSFALSRMLPHGSEQLAMGER